MPEDVTTPAGPSSPRRLPRALDHERHVDLRGRGGEPWARRAVLLVLTAFAALGLAGTFGQRTTTSRATATAGTLTVNAPQRLRGGVFYQGRFDITAFRKLRHPTLVLGDGWTEQMQVNEIEPGADKEAAPDGRLHLQYGELAAGAHLTVWLEFEVNPVSLGRRDQSVELWDGTTHLARVARKVTVFF